MALRVKDTDDDTVFEVSGRGELHLTILIENMRREGYELAVSRPRVVFHEEDGVKEEPYENLTVDVEDTTQGSVMEELGKRKGELLDMVSDGKGRTRFGIQNTSERSNWFPRRFFNDDSWYRLDVTYI
jgi:GTP-binding protein